MYRNEGDILLPLLKGASRNYQAKISSTIVSGAVYLDPFISLIYHSCDPNTWVVFESNHLRVRALKDVAAGTEMSLSLLRSLSIIDMTRSDLENRKALLSQINVECECTLCQQGHLGPTGELFARVSKYEEPFHNVGINQLLDVERAIADMKAAGFGFEARPMRSLYQHALTNQTLQLKTSEALKSCLALYYHIELSQTPPTPLHERIDTLFILTSLLDSKLHDANAHIQALEPLPPRVCATRLDVLFHLKAKVVSDTAKCLGKDSKAAKFEKYIFEDLLARLETISLAAGGAYARHAPSADDPRVAQKFPAGMNALMEWAELPTLTLDQYLR